MTETRNIDVFNDDTDSIYALIQYRLVNPAESELITGVKRDIQLLDRVSVEKGDTVNVFDISMEKNSSSVSRILSEGASIFYVDHQISGEIPKHLNLNAIIDTSQKTCTSLVIYSYLIKESATFRDNEDTH